jgi:hypothetical protein
MGFTVEQTKGRSLKKLCGMLTVMEYHSLDKLLVDETEKLKRRIALLEEVEAALATTSALLREAHNA